MKAKGRVWTVSQEILNAGNKFSQLQGSAVTPPSSADYYGFDSKAQKNLLVTTYSKKLNVN